MVLKIFSPIYTTLFFFKEFWLDSIYHLGYKKLNFFNTLTIVKFKKKFFCHYFDWSIYNKSLKIFRGW